MALELERFELCTIVKQFGGFLRTLKMHILSLMYNLNWSTGSGGADIKPSPKERPLQENARHSVL